MVLNLSPEGLPIAQPQLFLGHSQASVFPLIVKGSAHTFLQGCRVEQSGCTHAEEGRVR